MTDHLGWRSIFLSNVVIGLVILITAIWKIKEEWAEARGETFDFIGSIIYMLSLVATMYGLSRLPAMIGFTLLLPGIAGFVCLCSLGVKNKEPCHGFTSFQEQQTFSIFQHRGPHQL